MSLLNFGIQEKFLLEVKTQNFLSTTGVYPSNKRDLMLFHRYLIKRGLKNSKNAAGVLIKEAFVFNCLCGVPISQTVTNYSPISGFFFRKLI